MLVVMAGACDDDSPPPEASPPPATTASARPAVVLPSAAVQPELPEPVQPVCPSDMVRVDPSRAANAPDPRWGVAPARPYCVDRYESMLIDHAQQRRLSPYYTPVRKQASYAGKHWESHRFELGPPSKQQIPLPSLPAWQHQEDYEPQAISRKAVTPNGHVTGKLAKLACDNAGKRLCAYAEWRLACSGERGTKFPYGADYVHKRCNVFREGHPSAILHDDASIGHSDPRLNRVSVKGRPLLRKTGATPDCVSQWGDDGIFDMVGNLDEWVDDEKGRFAGGFYARSTRDGCDWNTTAHPFYYADYSTGVRCCADPR